MTPSQNPCKRRHPTPPPPSAASPAAPVALSLPGFVADRAEAAVRVERLLRYQFCDRALLEEALTHQSFSDGAFSYQRLEFVGDAALGLAFSNFLYLTNPTLGPGALSTLRAANISTEKLARVAVRHDLYPLLRRKCARLDLLVSISVMDSLRTVFNFWAFWNLLRSIWCLCGWLGFGDESCRPCFVQRKFKIFRPIEFFYACM